MIHIHVGDIMLDCYEHVPLDSTQESTWELRLLDVPSGKTHTISYTGENAAMFAVAAWLVADDPSAVEEHWRQLVRSLSEDMRKLFLP